MIQPKKHNPKHIVAAAAGIIALFSNLLLPGIAFSQSEQVIGLDIECGPWGITLGADTFEMAIFKESTVYMELYGSTIGGKTYQDGTNMLPGEAIIKVEDYRTEAPGCAEPGVDGWYIAVDQPNVFWSDGYGKTFYAITTKIITTNHFDATETGANIDSTHSIQGSVNPLQMWYPDSYTGSYSIQLDMNTPSSGNLTSSSCFTQFACTGSGYGNKNDVYGAPGTGVNLITNTSGMGGGGTERYKEGSFYTAIAYYMMLYSTNIPASEHPYSANIEFTMIIAD